MCLRTVRPPPSRSEIVFRLLFGLAFPRRRRDPDWKAAPASATVRRHAAVTLFIVATLDHPQDALSRGPRNFWTLSLPFAAVVP